MRIVTTTLLAIACASSPAFAAPQSPAGLVPVDLDPADFSAVHEQDGQLYGFGNHYRVLFHANDVVYQPILGKHEPMLRNLRLTMTGAGRGVAQPVASAQRRVEGLTVSYDRRDVREVYEVMGIGLKQSFVFDRIPAGAGDLIVTCGVETNMTTLEASAERLLFGAENGQVEVGKLVCFDAVGNRTVGSMQLDAGNLTMRLDAAFVDRAVAPLTVDPLVGTNLNVGTGEDFEPDCCFNASSDSWLFVWSTWLAATDADILGQRFSRSGSLISGGNVVIRTGTNWISKEPRVCNVRQRNRFVVAWLDDWHTGSLTSPTDDVRARTVRASDAALGTVRTISSWTSGDHQKDLAIGGNRVSNRDDILIGWSNNGTIEAASYAVTSSGDLTDNGQGVVDIGFGQDEANLDIADMDENQSNFWCVFDAYTYTNSTDYRSVYLCARDVSLNNNGLFEIGNAPEFPLLPELHTDPCVSYANDTWVIAWRLEKQISGGGWTDSIEWASFYNSDQNNVLVQMHTERTATVGGSGRDWAPEICMSGGSAFLAFLSDSGNQGDADVYVMSLTPGPQTALFGGHTCEPLTQYTTAGDMGSVRVASPTESAGQEPDSERVMIATHRDNATDLVRRRMFEVHDGVAINLGGGCGLADSAQHFFNCANLSGINPRFDVRNAPPGQLMWLAIGLDRFDESCGSGCTLVVDPFTAFIDAYTADANGQVAFGVTLPNDPSLQGMTYYQQWLMNTPGSFGCSAIGGLEMSDCLQITIQ